ncbi:MAG: helix-turn-helix domain-containing protein [Ornithinimicrobium sp.]
MSQQVVAERLRQALTGVSSDAHRWLPPGPWRVVALGSWSAAGMWESLLRRRSWNAPLVVELDGRGYAVVTDAGRSQDAGSFRWLRRVVGALSADGEPVLVGAGRAVRHPAQLPTSRVEALEALVAVQGALGAPPVATIEEAWAQVTIDRAAHGLGSEPVLGPLQELAEHDSSRGSDYLPTLLAWLDYPGEPRLAATELHNHPNTLRYRMGRIQALAGCDFTDRDTRLALHLQLRALATAEVTGGD